MPERVHTVFKDEPEPAATGLACYAQVLQKQSKISKETPRGVQEPQSAQPTQSQGVKRSRDGSPITGPAAKSVTGPTLQESKQKTKGSDTERLREGEPVDEPHKAEQKLEKTEKVNKDSGGLKLSLDSNASYNNSQVSANGSQANKSASVGSIGLKCVSDNRNTPRTTPRNNPVNRVMNGGTVKSSRKSSVDSNESRGSLIRFKPSQQSLQRTRQELLEVRRALPIWAHKSDIRWALRHTDVLLLVGETGSGKSTQVPQFLISEPWFKRQVVLIKDDGGSERQMHVGGMIAITEPRRVAATSLAHRVAQETGSYLGKGQGYDNDDVGYSVRFDTMVPRTARIKFLTEGMLLQELLLDPHLRKYSAVIIDEIHERSVDVDLLAGFLRNIIRGNKSGRGGVPLKLVVMSATANMEGIQKFFSVDSERASGRDPQSHIDSSTAINGNSQKPPNGTRPAPQSHVNGVNGMNGNPVRSSDEPMPQFNDPTDRRASDASYSSWDGIATDDETTGKPEPSDRSSSKAETTGLHTSSGLANLGNADGLGLEEGSPRLLPFDVEEKGVAIHQIEGRQHPVKILYTPEPVMDYVEAALKTIFKVHTQEPLPGDILVFLTGQEEIETLQELVQQYAETLNKALPKIKVLSLFGHQSIEQQNEAFAAPRDKRTRKVVLATNIAETSITVPGVRFVIDCGKAKVKQYRTNLGLQSLLVKPISKSSAIQRKGRAGREAPGKCYRLYTETAYLKLPDTDLPEILRSDVVEAVLRMKARGVQDVLSFPFLDPPEVDAMEKALFTLHSIGALDDDGNLNEAGTKMANFPLPAAYGRVLVAAAEPDADCVLEAIDIIACLTAGDDIFMQPKTDEKREEIENTRRDILRREGDVLTYLTTMQKYASEHSNRSEWCERHMVSFRDMKQAINIRRQLREMCLKGKMLIEKPSPDPQPFVPMSEERAEVLLKCFMKAFAMKTASLQADGSYCTTFGRHVVAIHPSSVLHGRKMEAIMFLEHVYTQKNYAKKVSAIKMSWIAEALEMA